MNFSDICSNFFSQISSGKVEIYNEFSLQHELGFYLRSIIDPKYKIQFERPVDFFGIHNANMVKKEIDISIYSPESLEKSAIELKYPRNGQHPEQIFHACIDICFLEQLRKSNFRKCWFIIVVEDPLFYSHGDRSGIYRFFRAGIPIHGRILKPTGAKDREIEITGHYTISWNDIDSNRKYAVVEI